MTAATYPGQTSESYAYDGVGNRTSSHLSASYTNQPFNRLTNTSSATYTFDDAGNTTSKTDATGEWHYIYDAENRLTEAHWPHNVPPPPPGEGDGDEIPPPPSPSYRVTNQYDALERRTSREVIVGGSAPTTIGTRFVYDGADVVEDLSDTGVVTARYLNGPGIDNKLRQQNAQSGATYYFLADQLGSTRALMDASGNVLEQLNYDSFGNSAGSTTTRYGYTGRERDDVTGLHYYRARFYDPKLGRFINEDPIGLSGGINTYSYVTNNPLRFVDPNGLDLLDVILGVSAHVAAGFGDHISGGFANTLVGAARMQTSVPVMLPPGYSPTAHIRYYTPGGAAIDGNSCFYKGGEWLGVGWELFMAGASIASSFPSE